MTKTNKYTLKQVVEELKQVPFNQWRYNQHENTGAFHCQPSLIYVSVSRTTSPRGALKYEMGLNDISEDETLIYKGISVKNLYEHLESQRVRNLPALSTTEEKSPKESLLEKLSKELKL